MSNVLLVYGYHKSGHYAAVDALSAALKTRGYGTCIYGMWSNKNAVVDRLFTLFRDFAAQGVKDVPLFLRDRKLLDALAEELDTELDLGRYDAVISTHPYSSYCLAERKLKTRCQVPLVSVHTDFTAFPVVTHPYIDYYCGAIPTTDITSELDGRLLITGIPVRKGFAENRKKSDSLLVMGGADGFGHLETIMDFIAMQEVWPDVTVVCGRNDTLRNAITKRYPKVKTHGFIQDPSELMGAARYVMTKASGVTVAEALTSRCIPIFSPPILSWEDEAAKNIAALGAGMYLPDYSTRSASAMMHLNGSRSMQDYILERGELLRKPDSVDEIADILENPKPGIRADQKSLVGIMTVHAESFKNSPILPKTSEFLMQECNRWVTEHATNSGD
jgi:UDP-N-acetylglucosamine:LPS N-acetylglucosamine transferase